MVSSDKKAPAASPKGDLPKTKRIPSLSDKAAEKSSPENGRTKRERQKKKKGAKGKAASVPRQRKKAPPGMAGNKNKNIMHSKSAQKGSASDTSRHENKVKEKGKNRRKSTRKGDSKSHAQEDVGQVSQRGGVSPPPRGGNIHSVRSSSELDGSTMDFLTCGNCAFSAHYNRSREDTTWKEGRVSKAPSRYSSHPCTSFRTEIRAGTTKGKRTGYRRRRKGSYSHYERLARDESRLRHSSRGTWTNRLDFMLSMAGFAIGMGNMWRFPYVAYKHGGGAFLVSYIVMLLFVSMPVFVMELALGQYTGLEAIHVFSYMAPVGHGLGYAVLANTLIIGVYYAMLLAWATLYLFDGMREVLPWTTCKNDYNSIMCDKEFPEQDYFSVKATGRNVVHPPTWEDFGTMNFPVLGCLVAVWIVIGVSSVNSVHTGGKTMYFVTFFPNVVLVLLFVRSVTLDGAGVGLQYYLLPDVSKFKDPYLWADAASQVLFSLNTALGGNFAFANFNEFSHDCHLDAIAVSFINSATSIFAGFIVFAALGHLASKEDVNNREEFQNFVEGGVGLAYTIYPAALAKMPYLQALWSFLLFLTILILGVDTVLGLIQGLAKPICEYLDVKGIEWKVVLSLCTLSFLLGLPMCLSNGIELVTLVDEVTVNYTLLFLACYEVVLTGWCYGGRRIAQNIEEMKIWFPQTLKWYWMVCWYFLTPVVLIGVTAWKLSMLKPFGSYTKNQERVYPIGVQILGWLIIACPVLILPGGVLMKMYQLTRHGETVGASAFKPTDRWRARRKKERWSSLHPSQRKTSISP